MLPSWQWLSTATCVSADLIHRDWFATSRAQAPWPFAARMASRWCAGAPAARCRRIESSTAHAIHLAVHVANADDGADAAAKDTNAAADQPPPRRRDDTGRAYRRSRCAVRVCHRRASAPTCSRRLYEDRAQSMITSCMHCLTCFDTTQQVNLDRTYVSTLGSESGAGAGDKRKGARRRHLNEAFDRRCTTLRAVAGHQSRIT